MADTILKLSEIEDVFQKIITKIVSPTNPTDPKRVRISYPTSGAPAWGITENVTFIQINSLNDPITKFRDIEYSPTNSTTAARTATYTRVQEVHFIFYGPDSYDDADLVRHSLFLPDIKEELAKYNLYLITDVDPPTRFPELYNGQWWQRADFKARFNELIVRGSTVPYLQSAEVKIYNEKGEI